MSDCVHIKGSLSAIGIPIPFDACIQLAAGERPIEQLVRGVTVTFDRRGTPAPYVEFLAEDGAEAWCAEGATRLALTAYLTVLRRTTSVLACRPRN